MHLRERLSGVVRRRWRTERGGGKAAPCCNPWFGNLRAMA